MSRSRRTGTRFLVDDQPPALCFPLPSLCLPAGCSWSGLAFLSAFLAYGLTGPPSFFWFFKKCTDPYFGPRSPGFLFMLRHRSNVDLGRSPVLPCTGGFNCPRPLNLPSLLRWPWCRPRSPLLIRGRQVPPAPPALFSLSLSWTWFFVDQHHGSVF